MSDDVSRETRLLIDRCFGAHSSQAVAYADILVTRGVEWGLIGPRESPRIWDRHVLNCVVATERVPQGVTVADVGSGAGLPGLTWAIARPDLSVTLIEPLARRAEFLEITSTELGLVNVSVVRARAEEVQQTFDVVTSRAVAALDKLSRWCLPLVVPGGKMLALKGRSAKDEVAAATKSIRRMGGGSIVVASVGDFLPEPATVVEVERRLTER